MLLDGNDKEKDLLLPNDCLIKLMILKPYSKLWIGILLLSKKIKIKNKNKKWPVFSGVSIYFFWISFVD